MNKVMFISITVALMLFVTGCALASSNKDHEQIGIRGKITSVNINENKEVTSILVEGKLEADTVFDKASISIDKNTKIYKGSTGEKLSVNVLLEGVRVEAVFEGPVAESYPVQGKAKILRILE